MLQGVWPYAVDIYPAFCDSMGRGKKTKHAGKRTQAPACGMAGQPAADHGDLYQTLGLNRGCSNDDVKRAYRTLALQCHPDKNFGNAEAQARFQRISFAYSVLSDATKREFYDKHGAEGLDIVDMPAEDFLRMFQDTFADMMGGAAGIKAMLRGMSKKEISKLPPFPFPKELFPPGTFPEGMRFSSAGLAAMPPSVEDLLSKGGDLSGLTDMLHSAPSSSHPSYSQCQQHSGPAMGSRSSSGKVQSKVGVKAAAKMPGPGSEEAMLQELLAGLRGMGGQGMEERLLAELMGGGGLPEDVMKQMLAELGGGGEDLVGADWLGGGGSDSDGSDTSWVTEGSWQDGDGGVHTRDAGGMCGEGEDGLRGDGEAEVSTSLSDIKEVPGTTSAHPAVQALAGRLSSSSGSTGSAGSAADWQGTPSAAVDATGSQDGTGGRGVGEAGAVPAWVVRDWMTAAKIGDTQLLGSFLSKDPRLLCVQGPVLGHTALHWCAAKGNNEAVEFLLRAGAPPGLRNHEGSTPLHAAARNGQAEAVTLLLASGSSEPQARDEEGATAYDLAVQYGQHHVAQMLLSSADRATGQPVAKQAAAPVADCGPTSTTEQGASAPVSQGVEQAQEHQTAVPAADATVSEGPAGTTSAPPALSAVPLDTASSLPAATTKSCSPPADTQHPHPEMAAADLLQTQQQSTAPIDAHGAKVAQTAPAVPAAEAQTSVTTASGTHGPVSAGPAVEAPPIPEVILWPPSGHAGTVCPPTSRTDCATSTAPQHTAEQGPSADSPAHTQSRQQAPTHNSRDGTTLAGTSAAPQQQQQQGKDAAPVAADSKAAERAARRAALMAAAEQADREEEEKEKLRQRAGEAAAKAAGVSPSMGRAWLDAAKAGDLHTLQRLLATNPALLHYQGQGTNYSFVGSTALHWACAKGHLASARWLLEQGADAQQANSAGATPLHAAVTHEHLEVIQTLMLGAGANAQVPDALGDTARDTAVRKGPAGAALVQHMDLMAKVHTLRATPCAAWGARAMRQALALAGVDSRGVLERGELVTMTETLVNSLNCQVQLNVSPPSSTTQPTPGCTEMPADAEPVTGESCTGEGSASASEAQIETGSTQSWQGITCQAEAPSGSVSAAPGTDSTTCPEDCSQPAHVGTASITDTHGEAQAAATLQPAASPAPVSNVERPGAEEDSSDDESGGAAASRQRQVDLAKQKGNQAFSAQDYQKAISHYSMAIRLCRPPSAVLHSNRAAAYAAISHFVKSLEDADEAVRLEPAMAKAHSRRGAALLGMRRYGDAAKAFQHALRLDPAYQAAREGLEQAKEAIRGAGTA